MSTDSDDDLDLSAWEAPPAPAGLADAVIARVSEPTGVFGRDGASVAPSAMPETGRGRGRRWVVGAIAAAALAAGGAVAVIAHGTEHEGPTSGRVVADKAQAIALRGARGELDPGTQVSWRRGEGGALRVEQPAGSATWRVEKDSRLWIDAGATVASVEAAGASLRVEVKMNRTDLRVIGASALTAGIVSAVTVTVYEGYVKVGGSQGQPTVVVQPGSTYTVTAPTPGPTPGPTPAPPLEDGVDVRLTPGESFHIYSVAFPVTAQIDVAAGCKLVVNEKPQPGHQFRIEPGTGSYLIACGTSKPIIGSYEAIRDDAHASVAPETRMLPVDGKQHSIIASSSMPALAVDGAAGQWTLWVQGDGVTRQFTNGQIAPGELPPGEYTYWLESGSIIAKLSLHVGTGPLFQIASATWGDGGRDKIEGNAAIPGTLSVDGTLLPTDATGHFSANVSAGDTHVLRLDSPVRGVNYYVLRRTGMATVPTNTSLPQSLDRAAIMEVMNGAKAQFHACAAPPPKKHGRVTLVMKLEADGHLSDVTVESSYDKAAGECVQRVAKSLIFPASRSQMAFKFPVELSNVCDAEAAKEAAMEHINKGEHAEALVALEESLRCKDDSYTLQLAFMESCTSHNAPKAQLYFKRLSPAQQTKFMQVCIRQSPPIDPQGGPQDTTTAPPDGMGLLHISAKPATAKILIDGVDTGKVGSADIPVEPGKHKVTFIVDNDRYTYPVKVDAGQTVTVSKDLQ